MYSYPVKEKINIQRTDPFSIDRYPRAFYHPTRERKNLTSVERKSKLSPERLKADQATTREQPDSKFLQGSNIYNCKTPPTHDTPSPVQNNSSKFEESWPSSERPSTINNSFVDYSSPIPSATNYKPISDQKDIAMATNDNKANNNKENSTLQKYIKQFRYGQPMSRNERQAKLASNSHDFWWLNSTSPTSRSDSTSKSASDSTADKTMRRPRSVLQRHMETSDSTLNTYSPVVSTDGLGSALSTSTPESYETHSEKPYRPMFTRSPVGERATRSDLMSEFRLQGGSDDILHQWRVRHKIEMTRGREVASKSAISKVNDDIEARLRDFRSRISQDIRGSNVDHQVEPDTHIKHKATTMETTSVSIQTDQTQTKVPPQSHDVSRTPVCPTKDNGPRVTCSTPIASPSMKTQTRQHGVEPHFHLLCDILPCPQQEHVKAVHQCEHSRDISSFQHIHKKHENRHTVIPHNIDSDSEDDIPVQDTGSGTRMNTYTKTYSKDVVSDIKTLGSGQRRMKKVKNGLSSNHTTTGPKTKTVANDIKTQNKQKVKDCKTIRGQHGQNNTDPSQSRFHNAGLSPVSNTIGQIVSQRMFTEDTSNTSSISDQVLTNISQVSDATQHSSTHQDVKTSSDSDEYDDDLTILLKSKRSQLESQLHNIDSLLQTLQSEESEL